MPFDAIFMTALAGELRQALTGGKVDKLYQPARDEAVLHMRAGWWLSLLPICRCRRRG